MSKPKMPGAPKVDRKSDLLEAYVEYLLTGTFVLLG
jgi:hypothetical protein